MPANSAGAYIPSFVGGKGRNQAGDLQDQTPSHATLLCSLHLVTGKALNEPQTQI